MGLLNSSLQIGRNAILAYQGALQIVGSNISGAASADYTRLTPQLDPLQGSELNSGLRPGAGVALAGIRRNIDEALESRIRLAIGSSTASTTQQAALAEVESFVSDVDGTGVATQLRAFWNSFDEVQNTPEDVAVRDLAITNGEALADSLRRLRGQLIDLGDALDSRIAGAVDTANALVGELADLNERITQAEAGGPGQATGLRDQRDAVLRRLGELFDVTSLEQPNGAINVYLGSEALVQGNVARSLESVTTTDGESTRTTVRFADTRGQVAVRGGLLEGLITSRDRDALGRIASVDELAAGMIAEVNRIHAEGQGLVGHRTVVGTYDVLATDAALNSDEAGLAFAPRTGSFFITVTDDGTQTPVAHRVDVNLDGASTDTTLQSLVDAINTQVTGVTAVVTQDRRLSLTADDGSSFTFGHDGQRAREDTSGVLAALGVNSFFNGTDAHDISVNALLIKEPRLLAAAQSFAPGDGTNAGRIASLDAEESESLGGVTITDFYNSLATSVATDAGSVNDEVTARESVLGALQAQKASISGVSLDEESISLLKFERAFQGVSRFMGVVDGLLGDLMSIIR